MGQVISLGFGGSVTTTSFTAVPGAGGLVVAAESLLNTGFSRFLGHPDGPSRGPATPRVWAELGAWLQGPAGQTLALRLAIQRTDRSFEELPGSEISATGTGWKRGVSQRVELTRFVGEERQGVQAAGRGLFVLRVVGRVTGGTGTVEAPTLLLAETEEG